MNFSSVMNSLPTASNGPVAFSAPLLPSLAALSSFSRPHSISLPPLSIAIAKSMTTSPLCARTKKRKGSSCVARSILIQAADKDRKSRIVFDFTEEEMAKYYHLPQRVAAKRLGVAVITIKRNCKRRGIKWPYRAEKLKEIQSAKATKPRHRSPKPQHANTVMTPMMMLSEAARAYSRLPIDCMVHEPIKNTTGMRC